MRGEKYRAWTPEDEAALREMVAHGMTDDAIAEATDRTVGAIRHRRMNMRLLQKPGKLRLTENQITVIRMARRNGWTWERISEKTGVGIYALKAAWARSGESTAVVRP